MSKTTRNTVYKELYEQYDALAHTKNICVEIFCLEDQDLEVVDIIHMLPKMKDI